MKSRFFSIVLVATFFLSNFQANAQGFGILIDSVEAGVGQTVCVPVRAKGFVDMITLQFTVTFDPSVLVFKGSRNYMLPGMSAQNFAFVSPKYILLSWADPTGLCVSRPDGTILFEVCFEVIGAVGSSSSLVVGSEGLPVGATAEAYNCLSQNVWSDSMNQNGNILVLSSSNTSEASTLPSAFKLFPNPTTSGTQLQVDAPTSGWVVLRVIDPLGKSVWASSTDVLQGNNALRIPATAFPTQGLYSVSVQTAHGVSTQMLLVR